MKKSNLLLNGILLSLIFGCSDKDIFEKVEVPKEELVVQQSLDPEMIESKVIPTNEPNKYLINFRWPKNIGNLTLLLNGSEVFQTKGKAVSFEMLADGGSALDFLIQLSTSSGEKFEEIKKKVIVPSDKLYSGKTVLTSDLIVKGGRLFLVGNAAIETQSFNVDLQVDEIISESGYIYTFPSGTTAAIATSGRSGGNITIIAKRSVGSLKIGMFGERGGRGRHSFCGFPGDCNSQGGFAGGNSGIFTFKSISSQGFSLNVQKIPGKGGGIGYPCAGDMRDPLTISNIHGNNCEGFGMGGSNGPIGKDGDGQACWKLSEEAPYECN